MASFTERYHEYTKYNPNTIDKLGEVDWHHQPEPFKPMIEQNLISLVPYLEFLKKDPAQMDWSSLANQGDGLKISYLARLLYFTCGINSLYEMQGQTIYLRCNPSAGGLYPIEVYILYEGDSILARGLYYFHPLQMALSLVGDGQLADLIIENLHLKDSESSGSYVLYTGKFDRDEWRYKQRSYRRILLDLGHTLENTILFSEFSHRKLSLISGFNDQKIKDLNFLDLDEVPLLFAKLEFIDEATELLSSEAPCPKTSFELMNQNPIEGESMMHKQNRVEQLHQMISKPQIAKTNEIRSTAYKQFLETLPRKIRDRRSCRAFSKAALDLEWLSTSLEIAFADHAINLSGDHLKFSLAVNEVNGLGQGVYPIDSKGKILIDSPKGLYQESLFQASLGQEMATKASVVLLAYANLNDATAQKGDRVYRYLCFDAGRIGQKLNLLCSLTPYGMSGIGGYFDDMCNEVASLKPDNAIIYMLSLGVAK